MFKMFELFFLTILNFGYCYKEIDTWNYIIRVYLFKIYKYKLNSQLEI